MVEHSMCQPGRPWPHGEPQNGSWGFAAFHSAKSLACRLSESTAGDKRSVSGGDENQQHGGHGTGGTSSRTSPASLPVPRAGRGPGPDQSDQKHAGPGQENWF